MLLAIDTATRLLSLAVHDGHTLLAEQTLQAPNNHTEILAPAIDDIVHNAGASLSDLTAIAVVNGPGSYTGVRIGVAIAKGLATARALPVVGVTTLDVLAAGQPQYAGTLIAVVRAGRGRVIAGRYRWNYARWVPRGEMRLLKWQELYETIDGRVTIAGEVNETARDLLSQMQDTNPDLKVDFAPAAYSLRRAGFAAQVAWERLNSDEETNFAATQLVPIYMNTID